ncbi:RNA recognition motif aka RRM, RBD, or RNP domain-containing protein [Cladophialophora immunda]|nr:RNA recognition motif aka RRM, RBD, or RNP domain-containing protein [Cladophialophora immunda]
MSYPTPPGLNTSQPPASLPARPPPSAVSPAPAFKPSSTAASAKPAFTAFAPRSIANSYRTSSPAQYAAAPVTSYSPAAQYPQPTSLPQYDASYSSAPQIRNPFVPTPDTSSSASHIQALMQTMKPRFNNGKAHTESATQHKDDIPKTVHRSGGGTNWTDPTLLEWDPAHFRIFVGNLAGEVTDDSLLKAFAQYPSVQKARVIRDKRTTKSKGYGFVSFADGDDYFRAARDMNGKYVGSHPIVVKKAVTDVRPTNSKQSGHKGKGGAGGHGKVEHGGVHKKQPKTKGGLRVLG